MVTIWADNYAPMGENCRVIVGADARRGSRPGAHGGSHARCAWQSLSVALRGA